MSAISPTTSPWVLLASSLLRARVGVNPHDVDLSIDDDVKLVSRLALTGDRLSIDERAFIGDGSNRPEILGSELGEERDLAQEQHTFHVRHRGEGIGHRGVLSRRVT